MMHVPQDKPLYIWYVSIEFPVPSERFLAVEVRDLIEQGHRVDVVTFRSSRLKHKDILATWNLTNLNVLRPRRFAAIGSFLKMGAMHPFLLTYLILVSAWGLRHRIMKIPAAIACCPRAIEIAKFASAAQPDIIHLAWGHYPSLICIAVRALGIPIPLTSSLGAYDLRMKFGPTKATASTAAAVRTLSDSALEDAVRFGIARKKLVRIYHGLEAMFQTTCSDAREPQRILTTARLVDEKRVDLCLLCIRELVANTQGNWQLHIAGEGKRRKQLEAKADALGLDNRVTFLGHLSPIELHRETCQATYFLLLSEVECLPNSVKEAMAAGCFCVVSETEGIHEIIEHSKNGWIVGQGDYAAAAEAIQQGESRQFRDEVTARAQQTIAEKFSIRLITRQLIEIWRKETQTK
jgi:glycosyltransferase involved in cell wall biosynthesis